MTIIILVLLFIVGVFIEGVPILTVLAFIVGLLLFG